MKRIWIVYKMYMDCI